MLAKLKGKEKWTTGVTCGCNECLDLLRSVWKAADVTCAGLNGSTVGSTGETGADPAAESHEGDATGTAHDTGDTSAGAHTDAADMNFGTTGTTGTAGGGSR